MRRSKAVAIVIAVTIAALINYFALQVIMTIPCDAAESCNQRNAGVLVVATSDIFALVVIVSELVKKR